MKTPTARQNQILRYINAVIKREGQPPTMQEIADFFGFNKSASHSHLVLLEKKGILRLTGASRGIEVLNVQDNR